MSKVTIFIKRYYHILFFLFLSSWILLYQQDGIISVGDFVFPVRPESELNIRLFAWKEFGPLGHSSTIDFVNIIYSLPIFLLNKIGFSISFVQSLFFIFLFFTASYSTYLLLSEILGSCKYKKLIAIISANFYIFNPYVFILKLQGYDISLYTYAFTPLILYLFYKYLKTKKCFRNKYLYLLGLCFLLSTPSNTQPAYTAWIVFILFFYLSFLFMSRKFDRTILYKSLIAVSAFFLINSFWLIPSLSPGMFTDILSGARDITNLDILASTSGQNLVEVFRFLGVDGFTEKWRGIPYFPYYQIYYTPIFVIIGFVLVFIGLSFLILKIRGEKESPDKFWGNYFFSIFLISIFFIGGTNFLFPNFKQWLFENFSVLLLYRKPYEKIGFFLIFSFAGLLAFSLKNIIVFLENKLDKYKKKIIVGFLLFLLLLINIYSFPFWTKQVFLSYKHPECKITSLVQYPNYYHELEEYLEGDKKIGRVLGLPVNHSPISSGVENYNWGYSGLDPIYNFINSEYILLNPLMTFFKGFYKDINSDLTDPVSYRNNLINFTKLFSVKKIVLRNDICWQLYGSPKPRKDKEYLQGLFGKEISLGKLDVFDVPKDYFLPHFYIPKNSIYLNGKVERLVDVVGFGDYQIRSGIYLGEINELEELKNRVDEIFVKGELTETIGKEELEGVAMETVSPYVKHQSGSLIYWFTLKKEELDKWKVRKNPEKLFEKHLFYASKRIAELVNFETKDTGQLNSLLENYKREMESAIGKTKKVDKLKAYLKAHRKKVDQSNLDTEIKDKARDVFDDLEDKIAELEPKRDFSRLVYKLDVPKEGEYEIYIKDINELTDYSLLGERNFEEGKQELILPFSGISENLIDENLRIKDYSPNSIYRISFDYKAPKGGSFFVAEGERGETAETQLFSTGDEFRNFEMFFKSSPDVQEAAVHLSISVSKEKNLKVERIYQPEVMLKFIKEIKEINELTDYGKTVPKITFVKINPTKYRVKVEGAKEPYTLVFSESFHKGWKAYINELTDSKINGLKNYGEVVASYFNGEIKEGTHRNIFLDRNTFETWGKKAIPEENHLLVNGYANSWYITPEDAGGRQDYELIIEFAPQKLFYIGLFISGITLAGCLIYLLYNSSIVVRRNRQ